MEIEIDPRKNAFENAAIYFEEAKKAKKKIEEIKKRLEGVGGEEVKEMTEKRKAGKKRHWFEKFRWFFTSDGFLVIGGKNAEQNEILVGKYLTDNDLFFHAEIAGAATVILKNGKTAPERSIDEASQFAASYSKAWKEGYASIDVIYTTKDQVSKSPPSGEYLPKGSFIVGKKKTKKNVPLGLIIGVVGEKAYVVPMLCGKKRFSAAVGIVPGEKAKEEIVKEISEKLGIDQNLITGLVPSGKSSIIDLR